jgi:hypothetical protein
MNIFSLCFNNCHILCYQQKVGKSICTQSIDGDIQLTSTKRKGDFRQPSSKRRKLNHKRRQKKKNVIEKSVEVHAIHKDETESSDVEVERKSEASELLDRMSAWNGLGIPSPILRALAEQGFVEPTEIQVRFKNQCCVIRDISCC